MVASRIVRKEANGKLNEDKETSINEDLKNAKTIDQLLGKKKPNKFGATDKESFARKVNQMNLTDLHKLGLEVGLIPYPDRKIMRGRLTKEFEKYMKSLRPFGVHHSFGVNEVNAEEVKKIMSRGKR